MLIRVVTTRADVPRTGEGIAFVHGEIQPQVAAMDGNRGFAMAVDRFLRLPVFAQGEPSRLRLRLIHVEPQAAWLGAR